MGNFFYKLDGKSKKIKEKMAENTTEKYYGNFLNWWEIQNG